MLYPTTKISLAAVLLMAGGTAYFKPPNLRLLDWQPKVNNKDLTIHVHERFQEARHDAFDEAGITRLGIMPYLEDVPITCGKHASPLGILTQVSENTDYSVMTAPYCGNKAYDRTTKTFSDPQTGKWVGSWQTYTHPMTRHVSQFSVSNKQGVTPLYQQICGDNGKLKTEIISYVTESGERQEVLFTYQNGQFFEHKTHAFDEDGICESATEIRFDEEAHSIQFPELCKKDPQDKFFLTQSEWQKVQTLLVEKMNHINKQIKNPSYTRARMEFAYVILRAQDIFQGALRVLHLVSKNENEATQIKENEKASHIVLAVPVLENGATEPTFMVIGNAQDGVMPLEAFLEMKKSKVYAVQSSDGHTFNLAECGETNLTQQALTVHMGYPFTGV